ncbi:unnamed protein product [Amoebophrya sp. A25]|nr:unnamed protein product [Amoebophrya sp. A25]|eukprot:GSA25T00012478001.1
MLSKMTYSYVSKKGPCWVASRKTKIMLQEHGDDNPPPGSREASQASSLLPARSLSSSRSTSRNTTRSARRSRSKSTDETRRRRDHLLYRTRPRPPALALLRRALLPASACHSIVLVTASNLHGTAASNSNVARLQQVRDLCDVYTAEGKWSCNVNKFCVFGRKVTDSPTAPMTCHADGCSALTSGEKCVSPCIWRNETNTCLHTNKLPPHIAMDAVCQKAGRLNCGTLFPKCSIFPDTGCRAEPTHDYCQEVKSGAVCDAIPDCEYLLQSAVTQKRICRSKTIGRELPPLPLATSVQGVAQTTNGTVKNFLSYDDIANSPGGEISKFFGDQDDGT